jgi:O-antigen ligase
MDPSRHAGRVSGGDRRLHRDRPTEGYRYARAMLIIFLATAVDVFNLLDRSSRGGPFRYAILLIPIGALIAIRTNGSTLVRRPRPDEWVLIALFTFGMAGTTYGMVFSGVTSTARALFLPMSVAILAVLILEPVSEPEARKLLRALAWIASIYIALGAVVYSGLIPQLLQFRQFKNATFPYVAIGIAATYLLGRRWWTVALVGLSFVIWAGYPSATSSLILLTMIIVFLATGKRASRVRPYVLGISLVLAAAIAVSNFGASTQLADSYFNTVGKRNTSQGRLEFWANGIATFQQSPLIGAAFATDTVVETGRDHPSPYHNDYILFLAEGGLLGIGLLAAWIVLLLSNLTRRYFGFAHGDAPERANLARLLLIGLSGFVVSMGFNPVLEGLSRSTTIFALAAIASTLGAIEPASDDEEAEPSLTEPPVPTNGARQADRRIRVR